MSNCSIRQSLVVRERTKTGFLAFCGARDPKSEFVVKKDWPTSPTKIGQAEDVGTGTSRSEQQSRHNEAEDLDHGRGGQGCVAARRVLGAGRRVCSVGLLRSRVALLNGVSLASLVDSEDADAGPARRNGLLL